MAFEDYKSVGQVKPFSYACNKVLPLVYDDSLSYYEVLCNVINRFNELLAEIDGQGADIVKIRGELNKIKIELAEISQNIEGVVAAEVGKAIDDYLSALEYVESVNGMTGQVELESLKNPAALVFTGAVNKRYDGSEEVVVNVEEAPVKSVNGETGEVRIEKLPNPFGIVFEGAVTAEYDGSSRVVVNIPEGGSSVPVGEYLPTEGGTMSGSINMSGNSIRNVGGVGDAYSVATVGYVDDKHLTAEVSLVANGWGESAPYSQTVAVPGVLATDRPVWGVVLSDYGEIGLTELMEYGLIAECKAEAGNLVFTCLQNKPAIELLIAVEVNR